jgi:hypothetical protein
MIDKSNPALQPDGYFLNNVTRLSAIPSEEIQAERQRLESRLSPKTANSSDSRELSATQSRERQQKLTSSQHRDNAQSLNEEKKIPSFQNLRQWPNIYYENLESMINLLKTAKQQVEDYSSDIKNSKSPLPFYKIINSLIEPYPLRDFISKNIDSGATEGELTASYLDKENNILAKLLGHEEKLNSNNYTHKESILSKNPEYLIHQARIVNILKTIDKSELNLRLSFINHYLQASFKQIMQVEDPIAKEAIFEKTVKFLNTNLIPDSLPSKETAEQYIRHLNPVIHQLKKINKAVPEPTISDESSLISALKTFVIKNIEEHSENLIRIDNLSADSKIDLFKNYNLLSISSPILSQQERIKKTLNTTDKTDINFRLALINLYLENNVKEIETNKEDKETRINKFQETVKFLDAYLLTLAPLKSEKQASEHIGTLKSTFKHLKALKESFPENEYPEYLQGDQDSTQRSPIFALKNYLADIVTKQAEKIIETSHLGLISKSAFINNQDINDIAGKGTIERLNNDLLEYLLNKKDFSISSRQGSTLYPEQTSQDLNPEYQFLSDNKRGVTYDKNILNQVLIQDLGKSITDNPLFFKFLELMIDNTPEHFQKLQNNALPVNSREDFKTSVLKYLNSATGEKLSTAANKPLIEDDMRMIKSLQALMLFEDKEIQQSSKGFYLKALQETKFPETLGTILTQLKLYQNFTGPQTGKSLPISLEDLNNSLQFSPVIKTIELKQLLEKNNVKELKKDANGEFILSEHPVTLTETEKNILNELEQVRANLLARQQPPLEP